MNIPRISSLPKADIHSSDWSQWNICYCQILLFSHWAFIWAHQYLRTRFRLYTVWNHKQRTRWTADFALMTTSQLPCHQKASECVPSPSAGDRQPITHTQLMFSFLFPTRFPFLTGWTHSFLRSWCGAGAATWGTGADTHWAGWGHTRSPHQAHLESLPGDLQGKCELLGLRSFAECFPSRHQQQQERKQKSDLFLMKFYHFQ